MWFVDSLGEAGNQAWRPYIQEQCLHKTPLIKPAKALLPPLLDTDIITFIANSGQWMSDFYTAAPKCWAPMPLHSPEDEFWMVLAYESTTFSYETKLYVSVSYSQW